MYFCLFMYFCLILFCFDLFIIFLLNLFYYTFLYCFLMISFYILCIVCHIFLFLRSLLAAFWRYRDGKIKIEKKIVNKDYNYKHVNQL